MEKSAVVTELQPGIFQIRGLNGSSHSYVIKGNYKNVMIDSGSDQNFPVLERGLFQIGLKVRDINLVINSHEHCDHIGANRYFQECSMVAAYRLAASKMITGDYYVTMYKGNDLNEIPLRVHLWLENMTRIDLGNYSLRVFHTPGHTSGCISIIETTCGLLFSADSVFAGGTLSYIAESGSIGDYLDSLTRLRCFGLRALYPGHGKISSTPIEDIDKAIANAQKMVDEKGLTGPEAFYQKSAEISAVHAEAAAICSHIVAIFARPRGARAAHRGAADVSCRELERGKFRKELERRVDRPLASAGIDQPAPKHTDHTGVFRQKQA